MEQVVSLLHIAEVTCAIVIQLGDLAFNWRQIEASLDLDHAVKFHCA